MRNTVALTGPELIRAEANLIIDEGWGTGLHLDDAARWVVHGSPCEESVLTPEEEDRVSELISMIEDGLGMSLEDYEAKHSPARTIDVAFDLEEVAYRFERELATQDMA